MKMKFPILQFTLVFLSLAIACGEEVVSIEFKDLDTAKLSTLGRPTRPLEAGWSAYEFGIAGDVANISTQKTGLKMKVGGGEGGQGLYYEHKLKTSLKSDSVISFELKAKLSDAQSLKHGLLGFHIEFVSGEKVMGRTDEMKVSKPLIQKQLSSEELKKFTTSIKAGESKLDLSKVDKLRFVIVAIHAESEWMSESYGSVVVESAKASVAE